MRFLRAALVVCLALIASVLLVAPTSLAQGNPDTGPNYFSQSWLIDVIERRTDNIDEIPPVFYNYHVITEDSRLQARLNVYRAYGRENKPLIQLLNRNTLEDLRPG
ncbi:MAG: hypothetical protein AAF809_13920, partial [Bacteroidota bacterium]